jgi:BirA family transcriptional regulator, biotin operon repressor / biotin---[acetyl-CoA-carboxylase] ligase
MDLDVSAAAAGVRLVCHDAIGSTNAEALALARAGERGPLWITAGRQTAGRGRRGRAFVSEPGNLFATLLLTDPSPPDRAAELSFVASLALHDAAAEVAPTLRSRLQVKWPNDVLCDGAKFSGILVEGESGVGRALVTVVGIGVNCAHHPADMPYPATDLTACGADATPHGLFGALSRTMMRRLAEWARGDNFAAIRGAWLERAAGLGDIVSIKLASRTLDGRFESLDAIGRLVLRSPDGSVEHVTAGDMFPFAARARDADRASHLSAAAGEPT